MSASPPGAGNSGAVVVTHGPPDDLDRRLAPLLERTARLVVVDNASAAPAATVLARLAARERVEVVRNETNRGVAAALNQGITALAARGLDWALLLDQDSRPAAELLDVVRGAWEDAGRPADVAVIGCNHRAPGGRTALAPAPAGRSWIAVASVITSGSALSIDAWRALGPMREELFIDYVDHEFCLRARARGWRVLLATRPAIEHAIGDVTRHRLLWQSAGTSNHAAVRRYYRVRNQIVVYREYGWREPRWMAHDLWIGLKSLAQMCLWERDRPAKLRGVARGLADGLLGRLGPARAQRIPR